MVETTGLQTLQRRSTGELLIELLADRGVEVVFGIPGVHTLELYRGLAHARMRHVTPRHEQGAAFMADGYGRVSDRPGVCLLITGAGLTNAATGIASAYHDSQPLLIVSSATDTRQSGRGFGPLHDLPDQQQFMATITASSETVLSPVQLSAAVDRAFSILNGSRPRPVHIGLPLDVLSERAADEMPSATTLDANLAPSMPSSADLDRAAEFLSSARDPVIILGGGARDAGDEALRVSAAIGAPIVTTVNGKGAIPESHGASLGATLTLEPVYGALQTSEAVLAVGTELSDVDYYYQGDVPRFSGKLIRVDADASQVNRRREPAVALVGDSANTLSQLAARLSHPGHDRSDDASARASKLRSHLEWWPGAERFFPVLDAISDALAPDGIVASDSTQLAYVANCYLSMERTRSYLCPSGYGTLGPALPMAIGAKIAAPDRPVVCLIGDGGLLFTIAELATAVELQLPIAICLWQNHGYGEIRDAMDQAAVPHIGTDGSAHDYIQIARGFGCHALRAKSLNAVTTAVASSFARRVPTLIELPAALAEPR
jgi:thiamine pyrophosphate-dependent acetolactate synthase large subunit-like protein